MKMKQLAPVILLLLFGACGAEESAPADARRVSVEVDMNGYSPAEIAATVGETITLVVTRTSEQGCGEVLVIPSQSVRRDLPLNEAVEVSITPTEAGSLRFTCGMDMYDGTIVVTE